MHERESESLNPRNGASTPAEARQLPSELQSFEAALAQLRPSAARIDRDRLMFLAGQASVNRDAIAERSGVLSRWFWPASSAVMTGVAAALLFVLVMRPPAAVEGTARVASQPAEVPKTTGTATKLPTQDPVERSPEASSLAWRRRITDELLSYDAVAHVRADLPDYLPADVDEEILSSRSYKQLLDEAGTFRRLPRASHSPKSSG
jgi:hypothetical protein